MEKINININEIDLFIFDFDGVLTNNLVYLDENGKELVCCSRADGLAFDVLNKLNKLVFILSNEKNKVVAARAKKLKVKAIQAIDSKAETLLKIVKKNKMSFKRILYVGNDLNDYQAMKMCKYSACPSDSHNKIKNLATFNLNSYGGEGVIRELLEQIFKLDFIKILYPLS